MSAKLRIILSLILISMIVGMTLIEGIYFPEEKRRNLSDILERGAEEGKVYIFPVLRDISPSPCPTNTELCERILSDGRAVARFIFSHSLDDIRHISVQGVFLKGDTFKVEKYWLHPSRQWKWVISFFSMVFVLAIVIRDIHTGRIRFWGK